MNKFEIEWIDEIKISSNLKEGDISALPNVHPRDIGNGYVWYWLPAMEIDNLQVVFGLCFFAGVVRDISVSLSNQDLYGGSWNDFSEEKENLRAKHTEQWLAKRGYKTGNFQWGSIWAGYDSKGGFGHAIVRYNS